MCFDCGKTPAQWASVNNGVYLCINCSGNHRGYGVNISYVRSLTLDKWNENQIGLMKVGGKSSVRFCRTDSWSRKHPAGEEQNIS